MVSKSQHIPKKKKNQPTSKTYCGAFSLQCLFTCTLAIDGIAKAFKTSLAVGSLLTACPFHFTHPFEDKNYYLHLLKSIASSSKRTIKQRVASLG